MVSTRVGMNDLIPTLTSNCFLCFLCFKSFMFFSIYLNKAPEHERDRADACDEARGGGDLHLRSQIYAEKSES